MTASKAVMPAPLCAEGGHRKVERGCFNNLSDTAKNPTEQPFDPTDRATDLLGGIEACDDEIVPLSRAGEALLGAYPVVLDTRQYARAVGLGLAGRLGPMQFAPVIFDGDRFVLAQDREDQTGAEVAFLFPALDKFGILSDVVAWVPERNKVATLLGGLGTLGLWAEWEYRQTPPLVHERMIDWWLAEEDGFFILDAKLAADDLAGVMIAAADLAGGHRLRARLASHSRRRPQIVIPQKRERACAYSRPRAAGF